MAILRIQCLGDLQMRLASGAMVSLSAKKSQALMSYLAIKPGQRVSRDKVALLLWSSTAPEQARQSLRQTLSTLRKELQSLSPDAKILIEENDLLGVDETLVEADSAAFEALVASGSESAIIEATRLYRGDFLDGFYINEERFDQWVLGERDRLHRMALRAHMQLIDLQSRHGAIDDAIISAQRSLRIDMLQEPVHRALMRLYIQSGDLVNALQQYETCARVLKRELHVDPDAETRALHREVLAVRTRTALSGPTISSERHDEAQKKAILVVEDNVLSRELTNALLKSAGYAVMVAKDGAEALMMIGREPVDLVLLDVDLPFIDGHSVLQGIRENGINVPAIFISGLPGDEVEVRAFEVGAADFIRKPVKNSVLLARVAKVLRDRD
jgi:DNA-binding SARP family transcriptional activator